jgi:hypothetical protein
MKRSPRKWRLLKSFDINSRFAGYSRRERRVGGSKKSCSVCL